MRTIVLDGARMNDRQQTHDYLMERLALPDYYGRNFDALADCLSEIAQPTRLVIYQVGKIPEQLGLYGLNLLRVLRDSVRYNPALLIELNQGERWPEPSSLN